MNRRGFLGALTAAVAGATLDPERALWLPGRRLISIPSDSARTWHHFSLGFDISRNVSPEDYRTEYLLPSIASINQAVEKQMRKAGVRRCVPQRLAAIPGVRTEMFGPIRSIVAFDPVMNEYIGRTDMSVMI